MVPQSLFSLFHALFLFVCPPLPQSPPQAYTVNFLTLSYVDRSVSLLQSENLETNLAWPGEIKAAGQPQCVHTQRAALIVWQSSLLLPTVSTLNQAANLTVLWSIQIICFCCLLQSSSLAVTSLPCSLTISHLSGLACSPAAASAHSDTLESLQTSPAVEFCFVTLWLWTPSVCP